ncbi:MAG TPA: universal stress protein [Candidatus Acidoferrales bacterium]|nr:universal stress protein [Candidatus Acidoferrales bacterium]
MTLPPKVILAPVDFSPVSDDAARVAADLAASFGATHCLAHVAPMIPDLPSSVSILKEGQYEQSLHRDAEQRLSERVATLSAKGVRAEQVVGTSNDIPMEIIRIAEQKNADLIVTATHGVTGWNRMAFGSVAEKALHLGTCPVLVLRGNVETQKRNPVPKESMAATD